MATTPTAKGTAGVSGSYSKTTSKTEARENREEESLSYGYRVVDTLKVPPKTKVEAMITTWAVTYQSTSITEITVDMTHVLSVHYWTMFSCRLRGIFTSTGVLMAHAWHMISLGRKRDLSVKIIWWRLGERERSATSERKWRWWKKGTDLDQTIVSYSECGSL